MIQEEITLKAKPRQGRGTLYSKGLRKQGALPAVLYGRGRETLALEVSRKEFDKVYKQAGENTLVDLAVEDAAPAKVLIHEVASHFMKQEPIHVDFYEVDLTRKITAHIPLHFTGESAAVKNEGGILVKSISEVEVEALPADLPKFIEVSIDELATFDDQVKLGDLGAGDKVSILGNPEDVVVLVQEPRSEEELAELEQAPVSEEEAVAAVAGEEKEEEGAEGAEGEEGEKKEEKGEKKEPAAEENKKEEKK